MDTHQWHRYACPLGHEHVDLIEAEKCMAAWDKEQNRTGAGGEPVASSAPQGERDAR